MADNTSLLSTTVYNFSAVNISRHVSIPEPPRYIIVLASVMYSLIFIAGVIANLSVVIVVGAAKRVRSRMSFLFANLSLADLLVLIVCMPSAAIDLFAKEVWYLGEFMCEYFCTIVTYYNVVFFPAGLDFFRRHIVSITNSFKTRCMCYI